MSKKITIDVLRSWVNDIHKLVCNHNKDISELDEIRKMDSIQIREFEKKVNDCSDRMDVLADRLDLLANALNLKYQDVGNIYCAPKYVKVKKNKDMSSAIWMGLLFGGLTLLAIGITALCSIYGGK